MTDCPDRTSGKADIGAFAAWWGGIVTADNEGDDMHVRWSDVGRSVVAGRCALNDEARPRL